MKIVVRFYGSFRELFGNDENALDLPDGASIQDLLQLLCISDEQRQGMYDDSGRLRYYVNIVLKNGRKVQLVEEQKAELQDGDVVSIFPAIGGG